MIRIQHVAFVAAMFAPTAVAVAQQSVLISSFEEGLEGWVLSGFNDQPAFLEDAEIGATDGDFSLAIVQENQGFSWNARYDVPGDPAIRDAFMVAAANPEQWGISYDVTFDTDSIPQAGTTFVGVSFWINSNDGFRDVFNRPLSSGTEDLTVNEVVSLADPDLGSVSTADDTFYQIGFALNGDWGNNEATVYIDNVRLVELGSEPLVGDCNGDGLITVDDLSCPTNESLDETLAALGILAGDFDGNGSVEFADFLVLSSNFGQSGKSYAEGNADGMGDVEFADFLVLSGNFGQDVAAASVPEPSTWILLLFGAVGLRRRRL